MDSPKICDYCNKEMKMYISLYDWDTHKYHKVHFKCYRKSKSNYWMTKELGEGICNSSDNKK